MPGWSVGSLARQWGASRLDRHAPCTVGNISQGLYDLHDLLAALPVPEGGRERGREGVMEGWREKGRDGGRKGGMDGGMDEGRDGGMDGGREFIEVKLLIKLKESSKPVILG